MSTYSNIFIFLFFYPFYFAKVTLTSSVIQFTDQISGESSASLSPGGVRDVISPQNKVKLARAEVNCQVICHLFPFQQTSWSLDEQKASTVASAKKVPCNLPSVNCASEEGSNYSASEKLKSASNVTSIGVKSVHRKKPLDAAKSIKSSEERHHTNRATDQRQINCSNGSSSLVNWNKSPSSVTMPLGGKNKEKDKNEFDCKSSLCQAGSLSFFLPVVCISKVLAFALSPTRTVKV